MTPANLDQFIAGTKPRIIARLDSLTQFETGDTRHHLELAIRHTLLAPSKCFRGLLVCATHQLFSTDIDRILPLACAIEMIHSVSLIYDDLPCMDNGTIRRNRPCSHRVFGEDTAILAGHTLQCYAYDIMSRPSHFDPVNQLAAIQWLSQACGIRGLAGGQLLDLMQAKSDSEIAPISTIHQLKTGAIIEACLYLPALLNASKKKTQLAEIGRTLGDLFQMTDDLLDVTGDPVVVGKLTQQDNAQNKRTHINQADLKTAKQAIKDQAAVANHQLAAINYQDSLLSDFVTWATQRTH